MTETATGQFRFGRWSIATYPGWTSSLADARRDTAHWLASHGAPAELISRAELIVSELATNAMEAAPGEPFSIGLRSLDDDDAGFVLTVANGSDGATIPARDTWPIADPLTAQGRGLAIVASLADGVEVTRNDTRRVVVTVRLGHPVA